MDPVPPSYRYLGLDELGESRHLMVDGAQRPHTTCVLSHWPASPTPDHLARDLSAEIALAYLSDARAWEPTTEVVTSDHLDVDGLISLFFLTNPKVAFLHADLLIEIARIGDFGVVRTDAAATIAWAIEVLMNDPQLAVVDLVEAEITHEVTTTRAYRALLQVLPRLLAAPELYASFAQNQMARFEATRAALSAGAVTLVELPEVELGVVTVPEHNALSTVVGDDVALGVDLFAIQSATDSARILVCQGDRFVYFDRYESWVRYVSVRHQLRRSLLPIAEQLSEIDHTRWVADPPSALVPVLHHGGAPSSLSHELVIERLSSYLATAPVAWDPFRRAGPLLSNP